MKTNQIKWIENMEEEKPSPTSHITSRPKFNHCKWNIAKNVRTVR